MTAAEELRSEESQLPAHEAFVDRVWRFFASWRLTLVNAALLLLALAAKSWGTDGLERALGESFSDAFRFLELSRPLHAWWLLLSLGLNLIASAVERLPRLLGPNPGGAQVWRSGTAKLDDVAEKLRKHGFRGAAVKDAAIATERGRAEIFGHLGVLAGLFIAFAAALAGRFSTVDGTQVVQPNALASGYLDRGPDGMSARRAFPGFLVRSDEVRVEGKSVETDVSILENLGNDKPGKELAKGTLREGAPLHYEGFTLGQGGFEPTEDSGRARIAMTEQASGQRKELSVTAGENIDAAPGLRYQLVEYNADFAGQGPAVHVIRDENGQATSFWVFQKDAGFDARNRPDRFHFSFERISPAYAAVVRVTRDPATPIAYAGGAILLAGLGAAFSTSYRRVRARLEEGQVALGLEGLRNTESLHREHDDLCAELGFGPRNSEQPT